MGDPIWSCDCGKTKLRVAPGGGTRISCYCKDCQAFAKVLDAERILDEAGGTELCQMRPDRLSIVSGAENLACLRLTPKGPLRWYASCCNTPLANTLPTRQVPFASLILAGLDQPDAMGPNRARVNRSSATAQVEEGEMSFNALALQVLGRAAKARLDGGWRRTPFFSDDGEPVAAPRTISEAERHKGYDGGS